MRFSIIIPAYNSEKTIEKAIKSVKKQEFQDFEIIVVNDNSEDNTQKIIKKHKDIKLLNNEEQIKAGGSRNKGIEQARGEYIIFLDSDDYLYNSKVLSQIDESIGTSKIDLLFMGFIKNVNGKFGESYIPTLEQENKEKRLEQWKYPNVWDICWNRKFLIDKELKFIEKRYIAEDALFYYEGIMKAEKIRVLPQITHVYTINYKSKSITTQITSEKMNDFYYMISKAYELVDAIPINYKKYIIGAINDDINYAKQLETKLEKSQK